MLKRIDPYRLLLEKEQDMNVEALIFADERILIEDESLDQLRNATKVKDVQRVLATPDIHSGYGVPIGAVVALKDKIIPSAVGYDVNCGMRLMTTPLSKGDVNVQELAQSIHRDIPLGEGKANLRLKPEELKVVLEKGVRGIRDIAGKSDSRIWKARNSDEEAQDILHIEENGSMSGLPEALSRRAIERGKDQLGTLGGGNHFIEIQVVEEIRNPQLAAQFGLRLGQILVMIHSGSRGLGHQIGNDYMPIAAQDAKGKTPDRSLGFFDVGSKIGRDYIGAMHAAANFAFANRQIMAALVRNNFRHYLGNIPMPLIYDVPHNMAKHEHHFGEDYWVHRKGATRAFSADRMSGTPFERIGQPVIIPGSMGTASYLLIGSARAPESLFSVNHGAGRVMSRTRAAGKVRRRDGKVYKEGVISDEEFKNSMKDVYLICENPHSIKEEAPAAYKDIDAVIEIVVGAGLAEVVAKMRPLAVLKG
jgi:tRNA-splicing ligase RtcB